jgi:hypothetical protein
MNVYEAEWIARERIQTLQREAEQDRLIHESLIGRSQPSRRWRRILSRLRAMTHKHVSPADAPLSMTHGQGSVQ